MEPTDTSGLVYKQQVMSLPPGHFRMRMARLRQRAGYCALGLGMAGIMAAILLPVFTIRHSPGYRASYLSNEKQVGLALLQYAQDYDETFPCGTRNNRLGGDIVRDTPRQAMYHAGQGWAGQIYSYVKYARVFVCPDEEWAIRRNAPRRAVNGFMVEPAGPVPISYAYNRNAALNPALHKFTTPEQTVLLSEVAGSFAHIQDGEEVNPESRYSPAGNGLTILASTDGATEAEAAGGVRYATGILGGYAHTSGCTYWPFYAPQAATRHSNGSIYGMADGHARFFTPDQVSPGDNALAAQNGQNCMSHRASDAEYLKDFAVTFSAR